MQENYETVTSLGFPLAKPELIVRLERGEEPWLPDVQACEERRLPRCPHTGGDTEPETPTEEVRKVDGTGSHDSKNKPTEVAAMEEEAYIGQDGSNNTSDADDHFDDMLMEEVEDKQWILKDAGDLREGGCVFHPGA
ncbi:zinc finger protein 2-like, partial [Mauremys reevesii]|uniref:zinc finger protein 2-like n=1 Tax=Mauremys reevesii TaxID=260615 RepID=UPI00193F9201